MRIRYFPETDTLYVELTDQLVVETREIAEDALVDLDAAGNLVALTVEHARERANMADFSFQQIMTQTYVAVQ
ncbi:MAG: DUF2283 domain-containing protein [Caldilineaceae bacterium]|nr:DUF2283 domain-containing protein [Caldilineaceae bacterium]